MSVSWSRRAFLGTAAALPGWAAERLASAPSELRRVRDPATEFELIRITDPQKAAAILPSPPLRAISSRNQFLIYSSDRTGSMQIWRMDLKSGESRQWVQAEALEPRSVTLLPDDKRVLYLDSGEIRIATSRGVKTLYRPEQGWTITPDLAIAADGSTLALEETRESRHRLRLIDTSGGEARNLLEGPQPVRHIRIRPGHKSLAYNTGGALHLVNFDGRAGRRIDLKDGSAGDAHWSADGRALHYLRIPEGRGLTELRDFLPDSAEDKLIGPTTRFVSFARNADSSVFAGISGSKGAPYVLLLVRAGRREMTLAEHRASDASRAAISFSPNSQRLFFTSDREGRSAIYLMMLDRLVEKTETSASGHRAGPVIS